MQQKQQKEISKLLVDLRQEMYVEYKISVPDKYKNF